MPTETNTTTPTWRRRGAIAITFALVLVVLLGLIGLVIDVGFLFAGHRQTYNAADAAVLAAAMAKLRGQSDAAALAIANEFIQVENGLSSAPDLVDGTTFHRPPVTGPYTGKENYIELVVTSPVDTFFIQILGIASTNTVTARAVAGYEAVASGDGVIVLDPDARPGLNVTGNGILKVEGRIIDNSEGGGKSEDLDPASASGAYLDITCFDELNVALSAGKDGDEYGIWAIEVSVVGGVDKPNLIKPFFVGDPNPLHTCQPPEPDPLINLAIPIVSNGVDPTLRGEPAVTNTSVNGIDTDESGQNWVADAGEIIAGGLFTSTVPLADGGTVILHPGVYESISVTGGTVYLIPGIYVISPQSNVQNVLKLTGGTIIADGVMFYNTGNSYTVATGLPDANDKSAKPPQNDSSYAGGFQINDGMIFTPIDTETISYTTLYPPTPFSGPLTSPEVFDGMLFFQRRRITATVTITGGSETGVLKGTVYAKWAKLDLSGQGTYDAQFVVGSLDISGKGDVTLKGTGKGRGKANQLFLVE